MGDRLRLRVGLPSRYVTNQLGQLSLASLRGHLIEYQLQLGVKAGMSALPCGRLDCELLYPYMRMCVCGIVKSCAEEGDSSAAST